MGPSISTHEQLLSFEGAFNETYIPALLELDYDEPNAVLESELEFVVMVNQVSTFDLPLVSGSEEKPVPVSQPAAFIEKQAA